MQRLTRTHGTTNTTTIEDYLACMMATIEDGLITAGAEPNIDYTMNDLFNAAIPMVRRNFYKGNLTFVTSWPINR